jgi:hypothetical protein
VVGQEEAKNCVGVALSHRIAVRGKDGRKAPGTPRW